ncbi:xylose isomerase-like TIM barrel family protein [Listeria weihenstephanensis FSL R9-0317]|uniref:Sugar phosphate isomerase n=1 Tax=Listeria weihenstephanensis TaxID=1006155 RepID=A0A1S7FWQ0_9LIST|nr:sugar phosphate isomerase/epimerase [Listeria weihenstephanensis]AQY51810.1 sugar phosphate isomerase [Listeria weihenstephanensis]EUJ40108.1 xylose isomerase-like TIM barrel family protein [Listeria weihenstephanensis FSL R9-0317]MBC1499324.1 sugar phosphate isomerase/epimerase [Listeria weihenstephanensis]
MTKPIAIQLWSVQEACREDFFGTLERIAEMGYDGVEFAGYYDRSAADLKAKLAELGLGIAGSHIPYEKLRDELDTVIAFEQELGNDYIVCPWADFETEAEWIEFAKSLRVIAEQVRARGLHFVYHNHAHEFKRLGNDYILDVLLAGVHGLEVELDTYWVHHAGVDVVPYMERWADRMPLVHLKDMKRDPVVESTEIGNGVLAVKRFAELAEQNGVKWLIIEQEAFDKDQLLSVEIGLKNLRKMVGK